MSGDDEALFRRRNEPDARAEITARYDRLARGLAARFTGRGEPREDLEQVARLGLVNAIARFDPGRDVKFATFATRTILGELKRHLRDKAWSARVPRSVQERWLEVNAAIDELTQRFERPPTAAEVAAETGASTEDVLEAIDAGHAYTAASLDRPAGENGDAVPLVELLPADHRTVPGSVAERVDVAAQIERLPPRQREILYRRFFEGKTQSEIATDLGISQMHVSRLLRRALGQLRDGLGVGG